MYAAYFGLSELPFSIAPDPQYLYMSDRHREAMAHLLFGIKGGNGFVVLAGDIGTGKTTLCRCLLEQIPEDIDIALILNPRQNENELLQTICDELDIDTPLDATNKQLLDALNDRLLESFSDGRKIVLVIDEAQLLSYSVLEQIRLLTNLETNKHKLLQIILIGQPELNDLLAQPELKQLGQRVTARYFLEPLEEHETAEYIHYRLSVAGRHDAEIFRPEAKRLIHRRSGGVPRLINVICDRALLGAFAEGKSRIDRKLARQAANEVTGSAIPARSNKPWLWWLPATVGVAALVGISWWMSALYHQQSSDSEVATDSAERFTPVEPVPESAPVSASSAKHPAVTPAIDEPQQIEVDLGEDVLPASLHPVSVKPEGNEGEGSAETLHLVDVDDPVETAVPPPVDVMPIADTPKTMIDPDIDPPAVLESEEPPLSGTTGSSGDPLMQVLVEQRGATSRQHGFDHLLAAWQAESIDSTQANRCQLVQLQGLRCWGGVGTIQDLTRLNRSTVLVLSHGDQEFRVLLVSVTQRQAVLQVGDTRRSYPVEEINQLWTGRYLLLWRPPVDRLSIGPDSSGYEVVWLRQTLHQLETGEETINENVAFSVEYDRDLMQQVRQFQSNYGLITDGIVGLETFLKINGLVNQSRIPLLIQPLQQS